MSYYEEYEGNENEKSSCEKIWNKWKIGVRRWDVPLWGNIGEMNMGCPIVGKSVREMKIRSLLVGKYGEIEIRSLLIGKSGGN